MSQKEKLTDWLKERGRSLGFIDIKIAKAEFMSREASRLEDWLNRGYHGKMQYMENHFDKRVDPRRLVPGAKSVVTLSYNYHNPRKQNDPKAPKISQYAYGEDYHHVLKKKLKQLISELKEIAGDVNGRCFVDSAPVLERDWARRSGLGWLGKNTLLLSKQKGSYFFLAELILDLELNYDEPVKDHCGECRRCIEACPTDAISPEGYILDSSRCISYLTIELREAIPNEFKGRMENWVFGCDICQEVCPWNRFAEPHHEPAFRPKEELMRMEKKEWEEITEQVFKKLFNKSAVKRTKFSGLKRNIKFVAKSS